MLKGLKQSRTTLAITLLALLSSASVIANTESCHVRITGTVPEGIPLDNLFVSASYEHQFPITTRTFSVCASKQELNVNGTFIPNSRLSLSYKVDGIPKGVFDASLFVQTKEVELSDISGMAMTACDRRCNYYQYQKMLSSELVANAVIEHTAAFAKISDDDIEAKIAINSATQSGLDKAFKGERPIQSIIAKEDSSDTPDPYSGSSYWLLKPDNTKMGQFKDRFATGVKEAKFEELKLRNLAEKYKSEFAPFLQGGFKSWAEQVNAVDQFVDILNKSGSETELKMALLLKKTVVDAEQYYQDYVSNKGDTPLEDLNHAKQSFDLLLANWTISAYLNYKNEQVFSALFSERFKREDVPNISRESDKALSQLMFMPGYFAMMNIEKGYENIQRNYYGLLNDSATEYHFKDELHSVSFIYEEGAWRLDHVSQIPMNHYEIL
ncbi:hypothetical protein [Shewanella baltica]|uniref:hypothetical protein n=1 Tax=Shewanella baltica TaxID=62322 RepID=UPI00014F8C4A|nr:hypothetical protein [Shewanella baltica]ABS09669.1 conserved hypothetical protein [Shewanella baltica OS185]